MYRIKFFKDGQGFAPIVEYISELRKKSSTSKNERIKLKKITEYMRVLREYGTMAGEPYVKHIDDDIWELRPTNDRIFFFSRKDGVFVMLHHFVKKTRKTPKREIEKAKQNLKYYLDRSSSDEQ